MLTLEFKSCEDKERDARRVKRIYGMLRSSPGKDRFSFMVREKGHHFLVEFPNETTGITPELIARLTFVIGEENVQIKEIKIQ